MRWPIYLYDCQRLRILRLNPLQLLPQRGMYTQNISMLFRCTLQEQDQQQLAGFLVNSQSIFGKFL